MFPLSQTEVREITDISENKVASRLYISDKRRKMDFSLVFRSICTIFAQTKVYNDMRKQTTIRLPEYMLADLNTEARRQGVSVSRLIENRLESVLYQPNADTLAAIEECRSGVELEELADEDIENFEAFVASL